MLDGSTKSNGQRKAFYSRDKRKKAVGLVGSNVLLVDCSSPPHPPLQHFLLPPLSLLLAWWCQRDSVSQWREGIF